MFRKGQHVVKSNTGICKIADIVLMDTGSGEKQYYVLLPIDDVRAKLYMNVDVDRSRLRPVMTRDAAWKFIQTIDSIEAAWIENDKLREQCYKDAFKSNEPAELVGIIKNLYQRGQTRLAQGKKIAATDEKYFKAAENALYSELAFALKIPVNEIEELITETIEG